MSIALSTLKCPVCQNQTLETLSASIGSFERCPECHGLFIAEDILAAASRDRAACLEAIEESKALLLPTEKWCPKCLQKLFDGRVRSRGVILTLCPSCGMVWTSLPILRQFEETIEKTLLLQMDIATNVHSDRVGSDAGVVSQRTSPAADRVPDAGLGHFFRAFARFFDTWADRFSGSGSAPARPKTAKPQKIAKPEKPAKKPLILEVKPTLPVDKPTLPETRPPDAPEEARAPLSVDIPEFIFPAGTIVPPPEIMPEPPSPAKPEVVPEPVPEPAPEPTPQVPPVQEPAPLPTPEPEAVPTPPSEPVEEEDHAAAFKRLMMEGPGTSTPPKATPKTRAPKPIQKKPLPKETKKNGGFLSKFKSAWSPAPKKPASIIKSVEPVFSDTPSPVVDAPVEAKVPVPPVPVPARKGVFDFLKPKPRTKPAPKPVVPKPAPAPKPVKPPKVKGEGLMARLFTPRKKPLKPAVSEPAPVPAPTPVSPEAPAPAAKKPVPVVKKPAPAPRPKREKIPSDPMDFLAVWPPWVLALVACGCSAFRDFGFEAGPAMLWGLAGWAVGYMVRLSRLYPFKPFQDRTLQELAGPSEARVIPVLLQGEIVPADEQAPKGEAVLRQGDLRVRLNSIKRWDVLPRFFGLSNPRQLLMGEATVKGWYRGGHVPSVEVLEVRAGKTVRKSVVRSLRWAFAVALLVLAVVISLALE